VDWPLKAGILVKGAMRVPPTLLELRNVVVRFGEGRGAVRAVAGVDLAVEAGATLGIVGESGCGKSATALAIMNLLPPAAVRGEILYRRGDGTRVDLARLHPDSEAMRRLRGKEIAMVFQEPMSALNPVYSVGTQIAEAIRLHEPVSRKEAWARAVELLAGVGIPAPKERAKERPGALSGGMRQRAMIAMAIACNPRLLLCDEPTTALDVTVQAQILDLLKGLQAERGTTIIVITHDLGVVAQIADEVAVMYMGRVVERGSVRAVFAERLHPYTRGLLNSMPDLSRPRRRLTPIPGVVGDPRTPARGCPFAPRCPRRFSLCAEEPPTVAVAKGHTVRCWLYARQGPRRPAAPASKRS